MFPGPPSLTRFRVALAISGGLLLAQALAPNELVSELVNLATVGFAVAALVERSVRGSPRGSTAWGLLAAGVALLFAAEVYWFWEEQLERETFPSAGEYLNAVALVVIALGLWRTVVRVTPVGDRTGSIDSSVVALALGSLGWLLIVEPAATGGNVSAAMQLWITILLVLDVVVLGVVARLGFSLHVRPPAYLFIYLAAGGLALYDGVESLVEVITDSDFGLAAEFVMMSAYLCWAIAAQCSDRLTPTPASTLHYVGVRRIAVLGASLLVPLGALTALHLDGNSPSEATSAVIGLAGLAIGVLVMIRIAGLVTTVRDVADERGRERFAALVEHSSDVILTVDREHRITYVSPAVASVWGYAPAELMRGSFGVLMTGPDVALASAQLVRTAALANQATLTFESQVLRRDGAIRTCEAVAANLIGRAGIGEIVVTMRDVTDRKALEAELTKKAFRDELTGLANRALFFDRVAHALSRRSMKPAQDVIVLFLDLDDFKHVNDGLGHAAGDELLAAVGQRLQQCVRAGDTVARLGGDEFAILLENRSGLPDAIHATERILEVFSLPIHAGSLDLSVRASIGVAVAPPDVSADQLVQNADIAMYAAKASSQSAYQLFDPSMRTAAVDRIALRADLERALDLQQLHVAYQPIVDLQTGLIKSAEALLRWRHPTRGAVSPAEFIPIAEQTRFILEIGSWVLERACHDTARLQRSGHTVGISINVSAIQLHDSRLVEQVRKTLASAALDPALVTLEITETAMMTDPDATAGVLERLRALGVRLAIDDFGTGYCSLAYLKRFAVDSLKIDRAFVSELQEESERLLAHNILGLADNLRLSAVAEGIETPGQLANLRRHGCDYGQGFHLARPIEIADFEELLVDSAGSLVVDPGAIG
ncbi:MAG: putative bifunctional diguanylate cyclase/phosphodiesterase [Gammaproteobacteria bacterium]